MEDKKTVEMLAQPPFGNSRMTHRIKKFVGGELFSVRLCGCSDPKSHES